MLKRLIVLLLAFVLVGGVFPQTNQAAADVTYRTIEVSPITLSYFDYTASSWYLGDAQRTLFAALAWLDVALAGQDDLQEEMGGAIGRDMVYVGLQDMYSIHAYYFGYNQLVVCIYTPGQNQLTVGILEYSTDQPTKDMDNYVTGGILRSYYAVDSQQLLLYLETLLGN